MAFQFDGNTPGVITYNGNQVQTLVYNGVTVWEYAVSVTYTGACGGQKISAEPTFTLSTSNASPVYTAGTYTYTLKIPYQKTMSDAFSVAAYIIPSLRDSSGNVIKSWDSMMLDVSKGTDVRYKTMQWTSTTWLGNASTYKVYIDSSGANKDNIKYPSGYNITLTAKNT